MSHLEAVVYFFLNWLSGKCFTEFGRALYIFKHWHTTGFWIIKKALGKKVKVNKLGYVDQRSNIVYIRDRKVTNFMIDFRLKYELLRNKNLKYLLSNICPASPIFFTKNFQMSKSQRNCGLSKIQIYYEYTVSFVDWLETNSNFGRW